MIPPLPRTYVEHLVFPRRAGDLAAPQAAGEVGSMVGGFGVRVTLAWRDAGRGRAVVRDAAARAFASAVPVAPASALLEEIVGRTAEEAAQVGAEDLLRILADGAPGGTGLPPRIRRGAEFAVEALRRALGAPGAAPADPGGPGVLVCRCIGVGDRTIREAVEAGARDPEAVGAASGAGTGCRSCRSDLLVLIDEEVASPDPPPHRSLHPVERIARARVGPVLRAHGLRILAVGVEESAVRLRLAEIPGPRPMSMEGAAEVARHLLRETVWDGIHVVAESAPRPAP